MSKDDKNIIESKESKKYNAHQLGRFQAIEHAEHIPGGEKIVELFKKGEISEEVFDEVYELRNDRKKTKQPAYKYFFTALANGKLQKGKTTDQREYSLEFLKALSGTEAQKEYATEQLRKIASDPEGKLSKKLLEFHISKLDELSKSESPSLNDPMTHIAISDTANQVEAAANVETKNWRTKLLSPEAQAELTENERKLFLKESEGIRKDEELKRETDPVRRRELQDELRKIDEEVRDLERATQPIVVNLLKSRLSQKRAIESLPINIDAAEKLSSLFFKKIEQGNQKTLKLILKADPETGKAQAERRTLEVLDVDFDNEEEGGEGSVEKHPSAPGTMRITIKDENGNPKVISRNSFIHMVNAFEIYEEIDSIEELNERVADSTWQTELKAGQKFISLLNDEEEFTIKEIQTDGKPKIILDRPITNVPVQWQSPSISHNLRHPRITTEYDPGEFAKLLKQKQFKRVASNEEVPDLLNRMDEAQIKKAKSYGQDLKGKAKARFDKISERDSRPVRKLPEFKDERNIVNYLDSEQSRPNLANDFDDLGPDFNKTSESVDESSDNGDTTKIPGPPAYKEEALAYEDINKVGNMTVSENGFLKNIWTQTRFLSVGDLWEMGKTMYEYHVRRFERAQKERYSSVAKELPYFGPEMKRINQNEENQQVNDRKEAMDQFGVFEIQEILRTTGNKDELKAALITLTEKGQMRWDDIKFWKNLSDNFLRDEFKIPYPDNGDPYTKISDEEPRTGFDYLKPAIDSLWGDGTYDSWYSQNNSQFDSGVQGAGQEGNMLEGFDGGHQRRLSELLRQHKMGVYIDPQRYEGLVLHMINNGKAGMQDKLYYIVQGLGAVNGDGRTILAFDRLGQINTAMLTKFPMLEYMTASVKRKDGGSHKWTQDDYKKWANMFDGGNSSNPARNRPGVEVNDFLWEYAIPSDETRTRINKVARNFQELDHDDMFAYLPPATERIVEDACKVQSGTRKYLTLEGYKNVFAGYSEYFKRLGSNSNAKRIVEAVKGYAKFEGIMEDRYARGQEYQRMGSDEMNSTPVMGSATVKEYADSTKPIIRRIVEYLNDPQLNEYYRLMNLKNINVNTPEGKNTQQTIDSAFNSFGDQLEKAIKKAGSKAEVYGNIVNIVNEQANGMTGMPFKTFEEKLAAQREAIEEAKSK
jgi:hypothetical protein